MCKVSVIVAVYNAEKYLHGCIDSLISQTLKDIEIILVNDGSIDSSADICRKYAAKYSNIVLLEKENGGAASARNLGMRTALGRYFCFVDSDDYIEREALEYMYESACKNSADIVSCGYYMQNGKSVSAVTASSGIYCGKDINSRIKELKSKNLIDSPCNKLYRADFIKETGVLMPENEAFEDTDFNLRLLKFSPTVVISDRCFYHYVLHMGSVTRSYNPHKLEIIKQMARLLKECTEGIEPYCEFYYVKSVFSAIIDMFLSCEKAEIKRTIKRECFEAEFLSNADGCSAEGFGAKAIKYAAKSRSVFKIYLFCRLCYLLKYKFQRLFLKVR